LSGDKLLGAEFHRCIARRSEATPSAQTFGSGQGCFSTLRAIDHIKREMCVGDVADDPRYLTAFGSTRSEIIVPILNGQRDQVVGTIDVESERANAFEENTESVLVTCAGAMAPLWVNG
jgi:putative methionine-R-sulfoxide reductase with GAF domain